MLPEVLDPIPEGQKIGTLTADGTNDTRRCHTAIIDRQATAIIPIRKNGRPWKADRLAVRAQNKTPRHPALRQGILEALDRRPRP